MGFSVNFMQVYFPFNQSVSDHGDVYFALILSAFGGNVTVIRAN